MKSTVLSVIVAAAIIGGALYFATRSPEVASTDNVTIENGKQIVEIKAKGHYSPALTSAQANIPTTLRVQTDGTFDCTSILRVPSIGYQKNLPPSGTMDIELPPQTAGATVQGICSMGMYSFRVAFK